MAGRAWTADDDAALILSVRAFGPYDNDRHAERTKRTAAACQQRLSKGPAKVRQAAQEAAKHYREAQDSLEAPSPVITPSRDKRLEVEIVRLREEGRSWSAIGDTVGLKRDKVRAVYAVAVGRQLGDEVDIYEVLRPIEMPAPALRPVAFSPSSCDLIAADFHWPKSDKRVEAVFLETARRLRPATVYLIGDLYDFAAFSKYDQEYRKRFSWLPQDEADAGSKFLHLLEAIVQEWDGKIVMQLGNHEERWWKWLNRVAPAMVAMDNAEELLSFQKWFIPQWSRMTLAEDEIVLMPASNDPLTLTHGMIVRAQAGASANAMGMKLMSSVAMGHVHRMGMSAIRVPARGDRPEQVLRCYEIPCMADLQPSYVKKPNWTNGFGILVRDEAAQSWTIESVCVSNGKATIATLGGTVYAE